MLPMPVLVIEPGSARILYANGSAHAVAGGVIAPAAPMPRLFDHAGVPLAREAAPLLRIARGETLSNVQIDWETVDGLRTVLVSGTTVTINGGQRGGGGALRGGTKLESGGRGACGAGGERE